MSVAASPPEHEERRVRSGGRLIWDASDELDLLGDLWLRLPFSIGQQRGFFFDLDARTSIEKTTSDLTFVLRDLDYAIDLGWRRPRTRSGLVFSFMAGQRGKQRVDEDGQFYARYLAAGLDARRGEHWTWGVGVGPVVKEREVQADAVIRGEAHYRLARFGIDFELDGLIDGDRLLADASAGPSYRISLAGDHEARFFLHYQRSRNPLGIGHSALLGGFEYRDAEGGAGNRRLPAPRVDGVLGAGGGDGRLAGTLLLHVLSPELARRYRVAFLVDANILTADETGELYYLFDLGVERSLRRGVAGIYFYHRSNHQLSEPNPEITSINVLEVGVQTRGWRYPGRRELERSWGDLEAGARLGYLIDSAFGEDRHWHLRGGARWAFPATRRLFPYLLAELEAGDVERETFAVGVSLSSRTDLQIEHRDDDQFYGVERTAWLLAVRSRF